MRIASSYQKITISNPSQINRRKDIYWWFIYVIYPNIVMNTHKTVKDFYTMAVYYN